MSILSLDLSSIFDKVSYKWLLQIMQKKHLLEQIVCFASGFLVDQRTQLTFSSYTSVIIPIQTNILQGSSLLLILFLLFASKLLEMFDIVNSNKIGLGFVNNTNLIVQGLIAIKNYYQLEATYTKCTKQAQRHSKALLKSTCKAPRVAKASYPLRDSSTYWPSHGNKLESLTKYYTSQASNIPNMTYTRIAIQKKQRSYQNSSSLL